MALPLVAATNISKPTSPDHYAVNFRHANSGNPCVQTIGKQIKTPLVIFLRSSQLNSTQPSVLAKHCCFFINRECSSALPELREPSMKHTLMLSVTIERCWFKTEKAANRLVKKRMLRDDLLNFKHSNLNFQDIQTTLAQMTVLLQLLPYFSISLFYPTPSIPILQLYFRTWQ